MPAMQLAKLFNKFTGSDNDNDPDTMFYCDALNILYTVLLLSY